MTGSKVAVIPARGGSKRIERKNIRMVGGRPLLGYAVETALDSGLFDRVIVSSEDAEICKIAVEWGAEALDRPASLAGDMPNVPDVVRHHLAEFEAAGTLPDFCCILYATAALVRPDDLRGAFEVFGARDDVDFVMAVSSFPLHPYKALAEEEGDYLRPLFAEQIGLRSQDVPDYVAPNGTFHWGRSRAFLQNIPFADARRVGYRIPFHRAVDIDEPEDLELLEHLLAREGRVTP